MTIEMHLQTIKFSMNFLGLLSSGIGASIIAYHLFSFRPKYQAGTIGGIPEQPKHDERNRNLIKIAMVLIPFGAALQLVALFIDP